MPKEQLPDAFIVSLVFNETKHTVLQAGKTRRTSAELVKLLERMQMALAKRPVSA